MIYPLLWWITCTAIAFGIAELATGAERKAPKRDGDE